MKRRKFLQRTITAVGLGLFSPISLGFSTSRDFDIIFRNGLVVDGTGEDGFYADIAVAGDRLVAMGNLRDYSAHRIVELDGLVIAPGFIDVHSHSEDELLVNPLAESKVRQGVTTEIVGQDGNSIAPLTPEMQAKLSEVYRANYNTEVDWLDLQGYFNRLMTKGVAVNLGTLVGQGTLREYVIGHVDRPATFREFERMQALARHALKQGAMGISSGLEYTPGAFASREEVIALCEVMDFSSGIYATHIRDEADFILEALDEAIEVARRAEIPLHIAHLKCMGQRNWPKIDAVFEKIRQARFKGVSLTMDRYPYTAYNTSLSSLFPLWAREGDNLQFITRLRSPDLLPKIKEETLAKVKLIGSWDSILITSVELEKNQRLLGRRVSEAVAQNGHDGFEFVRKLIIEENNGVGMCGFAMSEENTATILAHSSCMIASDASARADYGLLSHSNPHPRTYGTFPRVLGKYVREQKLLTLPEAIRKMTWLPASRFGIKKRGRIAEGFFADLVIFDSAKIADQATYSDPHRYPEGIEYVLVNGQLVVENQHHTGAVPGQIV